MERTARPSEATLLHKPRPTGPTMAAQKKASDLHELVSELLQRKSTEALARPALLFAHAPHRFSVAFAPGPSATTPKNDRKQLHLRTVVICSHAMVHLGIPCEY